MASSGTKTLVFALFQQLKKERPHVTREALIEDACADCQGLQKITMRQAVDEAIDELILIDGKLVYERRALYTPDEYAQLRA